MCHIPSPFTNYCSRRFSLNFSHLIQLSVGKRCLTLKGRGGKCLFCLLTRGDWASAKLLACAAGRDLHPKPEAPNPNPKTRNSKTESRSLKTETRIPKLETRTPKPEARKPEARDSEARSPVQVAWLTPGERNSCLKIQCFLYNNFHDLQTPRSCLCRSRGPPLFQPGKRISI